MGISASRLAMRGKASCSGLIRFMNLVIAIAMATALWGRFFQSAATCNSQVSLNFGNGIGVGIAAFVGLVAVSSGMMVAEEFAVVKVIVLAFGSKDAVNWLARLIAK